MPTRIEASIEGVEEAWSTPLGVLYRGDAVRILPAIADASVDLVFADPPFNLGKSYGARVDDRREEADYLEWCRGWLDELVRVLRPGGSLFLFNLPRWNIHLAVHLHGKLTFRHWIAVDIKYSLPVPGRLYPAHYGLLYYCKGPKPTTFKPPRVPMTTCRHCGGELKDYGGYKDKLNTQGFNLSDVWSDIAPVRHPRYKLAARSSNQLSLKMLDRVLDIASIPGDLLLDPFAGSGTALVAAELKHRHWIGIEIEDVEPIVGRLDDLAPDQEHLGRLAESKNRLFTDAALALRRMYGHWNGRSPAAATDAEAVAPKPESPNLGLAEPSEQPEPRDGRGASSGGPASRRRSS